MKKEIKYELVTCIECHGTGFVRTDSCSCTSCENMNTCKNCNGKKQIKIIRYVEKNIKK